MKTLSFSDIDHLNGEIAEAERCLERLDPSGEGLDATHIYEILQDIKEYIKTEAK